MREFLTMLLIGTALFLFLFLFLLLTSDMNIKRKPTTIYYDSSRAVDITLTCKSGYIFAITDKGGLAQVYEADGRPMVCIK